MILKHQPRLDTILMVEKTIEKNSGEFGKYQLWRKLPKSMMYQTYLNTIEYLIYSKKIALDKNKKITWIFSPKTYKQFKRLNLKR